MLNIKIFRQTMCDGVGGHGKKKKVVVTGFGPFTGYPQNPSSMVVKKLMDDRFGETLDNGVELTLEIVEVDYEKAMATSCRACDAIEADVIWLFVICVRRHFLNSECLQIPIGLGGSSCAILNFR